MDTPFFANAKLKVKRADQHISNLNEMLNSILKTDFYGFVVEKDENTDKNSLHFLLKPSLSEDTGLIMGDAIHNLRSALDNLWWELVDRYGGICDQNTFFPITKTEKNFEKTIKDRGIESLSSDIAGLLRKNIKPYRGGNDPLYALNELNNINKHRLLIPIYSNVEFRGVTGNIGTAKFRNSSFVLGQDAIMSFPEITEKYEFQHNGNPRLTIVFGEKQPFEFEPIIPTLQNLSILVSGIVQNVENTYLARN